MWAKQYVYILETTISTLGDKITCIIGQATCNTNINWNNLFQRTQENKKLYRKFN